MPSVVDLFSRKMPRRGKSKLPALETEPKAIRPRGPPPPYHQQAYFVDAEDGATTVSEYSYHRSQTPPAFNSLGKRRASWSNLMESDENLQRSSTLVSSQHNGHHALYKPIAFSDGRLRLAQNLNYADSKPKKAMKLNVEKSLSKRWNLNKDMKLYGGCTPKLILLWFIVALLLSLLVTIIVVIARQALMPPSAYSFTWNPPQQLSGDRTTISSKLFMKVMGGNQVEFELRGNMPLKSNYRTVIDFATGNIAIIDHALKNNGKNLVCFLLKLNKTNIPDMVDLRVAARNAISIESHKDGWRESWQYLPEPVDTRHTGGLFAPPIEQCQGVRWIVLKQTPVSQQAMKCSQCYDFCLPEYGIETDRVGNFNYLNIIRRDCFYLFVPEWRKFAQAYNEQQNQHDFEQFYMNQRVAAGMQPAVPKPAESKWISVQPNSMRNGADVANPNGAQNYGLQPGFAQVPGGYQQGVYQQPANNEPVQQNFVLPPGYIQMPEEASGRNGRYQPSTTGAPSQQQSLPNWQNNNNNPLNSNANPIPPYNNGHGWIRVGGRR